MAPAVSAARPRGTAWAAALACDLLDITEAVPWAVSGRSPSPRAGTRRRRRQERRRAPCPGCRPGSRSGAAGAVLAAVLAAVLRELYAGDGCHRLALLINAGHTSLPPAWYRVSRRARRSVIDNTYPLLSMLPLSQADYLRYISLGYSDRTFTDVDALLADVARYRPDRLHELRSVLAIDADGPTSGAGGLRATG